METGIALKILRERRNLSQRQLADILKVTHSSISRIESNETQINYDSLITHLGALKVSLEDFKIIKQSNSDLHYHIARYFENFDKKNNDNIKAAFNYFKDEKNTSLDHYFYYLKIKLFFSTTNPTVIPPFTIEELEEIYIHIMTSNEYTIFDYELIADLVPVFHDILGLEKLTDILNKMLPISVENTIARNNTFRSQARTLMNNTIDIFILNKDFKNAQRYLNFFNHYLKLYPNLQFDALAVYYSSVIGYSIKKNKKDLKLLKKNIAAHKFFRSHKTVKGLSKEVESLENETPHPSRTEITVYTEY